MLRLLHASPATECNAGYQEQNDSASAICLKSDQYSQSPSRTKDCGNGRWGGDFEDDHQADRTNDTDDK